MASLVYTAQDEYGKDIVVRLPDWTGHLLFATTSTPPDGTLVADGSEVSRTAYPELFKKIGTQYGAGDGANTFNLPDWRDEFPRFSGAERAVGSKQGDAIRDITGMVSSVVSSINPESPHSGATGAFSWVLFDDGAYSPGVSGHYNDLSFSADNVVPTADENRPRNVAFLPCIVYL